MLTGLVKKVENVREQRRLEEKLVWASAVHQENGRGSCYTLVRGKAMRRPIAVVLSVTASLGLLCAQDAVQRLQDVKKVYVGSFGDGPGSELIRSKLISRLAKSNRVEVVEVPDQADAVLTGVGELSTTAYYNANSTDTNATASGGTRYHATAGVRLVNKQQKILWADEASNGLFFRSASSSLADKIVKNLLRAMSQGDKKK